MLFDVWHKGCTREGVQESRPENKGIFSSFVQSFVWQDSSCARQFMCKVVPVQDRSCARQFMCKTVHCKTVHCKTVNVQCSSCAR